MNLNGKGLVEFYNCGKFDFHSKTSSEMILLNQIFLLDRGSVPTPQNPSIFMCTCHWTCPGKLCVYISQYVCTHTYIDVCKSESVVSVCEGVNR